MEFLKPHIGHLVLITSFIGCSISAGMGYANSAYYYSLWLETFGEDSWLTSMVGSLNIGAVCLAGPLAGAMIDRCGYRFAVLFGSSLSFIGMVVSSFSPNIYVLLIFYCLTGIGWCFIYISACLAFTHYYSDKYHGICLGIITCGAGFGHFITPPIVDYLTEKYTWRGAMLIEAGLSAQTFLFGAALIPTDSMKLIESKISWRLRLFKNTDFLFLLLHSLLFTTALSVIFVHFAYSVEQYCNVDSKQSALVVSSMGLASLFGRLIHGFICKLENVNAVLQVMISFIIAGCCTFLIPFINIFWITVIVTIVLGFCIGPYGSVIVMIVLETVKSEDAPLAYGYVNLMGGIGLYIGAPIAGALYDETRNYLASMIFGGVIFICSGLVLLKSAIGWQLRIRRRDKRGECKRIDVDGEEEIRLSQADEWNPSHRKFFLTGYVTQTS